MGRYLIALLLLSGCHSATKEKLYSLKKGISLAEVDSKIGSPDHFYISDRWGDADTKALYVVSNESCYVHFIDLKFNDVVCRRGAK